MKKHSGLFFPTQNSPFYPTLIGLFHPTRTEGYSQREIGRFCQIGKGSVFRLLSKAEELDLTSVELDSMTDSELEQRFFPSRSEPRRDKMVPDFRKVHDHLTHTHHRSLMHEWFDYREQNPDGYSYSRFLDLYRQWCGKFSVKRYFCATKSPESACTLTNQNILICRLIRTLDKSSLFIISAILSDLKTEKSFDFLISFD